MSRQKVIDECTQRTSKIRRLLEGQLKSIKAKPTDFSKVNCFNIFRTTLFFLVFKIIDDQWVWEADISGRYSVKSACSVLRQDVLEEAPAEAFKELWKLKVPSKVTTFAWRLLNDRLPTKDNLRRKHVELNDHLCPFCSSVEESASHLFFHCSKVLPLWWESLSWVNMVVVFPNHPRQHFIQHMHQSYEGLMATRWKWWWLALTWSIWKHRNSIIFSGSTFNANKMMEDAVFLLWTWLRHLEKGFQSHFNQWSSNIREGFRCNQG